VVLEASAVSIASIRDVTALLTPAAATTLRTALMEGMKKTVVGNSFAKFFIP